jgi:hypothetical protein
MPLEDTDYFGLHFMVILERDAMSSAALLLGNVLSNFPVACTYDLDLGGDYSSDRLELAFISCKPGTKPWPS